MARGLSTLIVQGCALLRRAGLDRPLRTGRHTTGGGREAEPGREPGDQVAEVLRCGQGPRHRGRRWPRRGHGKSWRTSGAPGIGMEPTSLRCERATGDVQADRSRDSGRPGAFGRYAFGFYRFRLTEVAQVQVSNVGSGRNLTFVRSWRGCLLYCEAVLHPSLTSEPLAAAGIRRQRLLPKDLQRGNRLQADDHPK